MPIATANGPLVLCILDGYGLNPAPLGNAVMHARKPSFDWLMQRCPNTTLTTFGERVGLPAGQMGNSEVGHQNIGAGRVVEQSLLRISKALKAREHQVSSAIDKLLTNTSLGSTVHLVGLLSDGGVHSHQEHLHLLIDILISQGAKKIALHIITDGRDTGPRTGGEYLKQLLAFLETRPQVHISTVSGRFFAMDRDTRWERSLAAYKVIALGTGSSFITPLDGVAAAYQHEVSDEFIDPFVVGDYSGFHANDSVIFWNFREDRMRQLVALLCEFEAPHIPAETVTALTSRISPAHCLSFTEYDSTFPVPFIFPPFESKHILGEVISNAGLKQLRVAETEKYPHVTYFFNGGREEPYSGEERALIPSPRDVKTYDQKPQMSALEVCATVIAALDSKEYHFIVVNFANADMVGHTGNMAAAIEAVECVDSCLGFISNKVAELDGTLLVLADHGNAEQMINYIDGTPHTAHTTYPVPFILQIGGISADKSLRFNLAAGGALCDVAPTVLALLEIPQPREMGGRSLLTASLG